MQGTPCSMMLKQSSIQRVKGKGGTKDQVEGFWLWEIDQRRAVKIKADLQSALGGRLSAKSKSRKTTKKLL